MRDSNTQCRIWEHVNPHPDQFCCWITQQRDSSPTKCAIFACCMRFCIRSAFSLVVVLTVSTLASLGCFYLLPPCGSLHDPWQAKLKPISSRSWIGSKSQRWAGNLEDWLENHNHCTYAVRLMVVKNVVFSFALRLEILCRIDDRPDVLSLLQTLGWRWTVFSLERSSVATNRPELNAPAASSCVELDVPGVVLVTLSESCWHRFWRLASPPAWYSGGFTGDSQCLHSYR